MLLPAPEGEYGPGKQGVAFSEVVRDHGVELPSADEMLISAERQGGELPAAVEAAKTGLGGITVAIPQPPALVRPFQLADDSPVLHLQFAEAAGAYDYGRWWHTWIEMFPWDDDFAHWEEYARRAEPPAIYDDRARQEIA